MLVSIIVPIHNESENLQPLHEELSAALQTLPHGWREWEILFVDDGSTDDSLEKLEAIAARDPNVRLIQFRRNYGQTAAMQAGFEAAAGDCLVTIDGDLQNDPADIPEMLRRIDSGYDLVHGWRKVRKDNALSRRLPSRIANWLISRVTRFPIHDLGCTLKAIRREIADELELYGEMHRFIPILAYARGARCYEMVTHHRPRRFGKTKYGLSRTFRVILDLLTVKYMLDYFDSPMKLFGKLGLVSFLASGLSIAAVAAMKSIGGVDMTGNPLLLLGVLMAILGVQSFSLGLIGEVAARIYYQRNHRRPFAIRTSSPQPHSFRAAA